MKLIDFSNRHIPQALELVRANYEEERRAVPALPPVEALPSLAVFAEDGLGVAAVEGERLLGFLGTFPPRDHPWGIQGIKSAFSPIHGHGAVEGDRKTLYSRLYQAAAEKWVRAGIASHAVSIYAHDAVSQESFVWNGFGMRCVDAVRELTPIETVPRTGCCYREVLREGLSQNPVGEDWLQIVDLENRLVSHEASSPYFLWNPPVGLESFQAELEEDARFFVAQAGETCAAYLKVIFGGAETFVAEERCMPNIKGAYCLPAFRGKGVYQTLLAYAAETLRREGYRCLGVDFESTNPAGSRFWRKHFFDYTHSYVRRIDETMLGKR